MYNKTELTHQFPNYSIKTPLYVEVFFNGIYISRKINYGENHRTNNLSPTQNLLKYFMAYLVR